MSEFAIETRGLTKLFDGDVVVSNLDLVVPQGSIFGLMGPNGAGKSTLIRMLMGILKPTAGSGTILGRPLDDPSGLVRAQVGYVADFQQMYPMMKVRDVIELCARVYPQWDKKRAELLMKTFNVAPNKWVRALSKGMKTQLALLIALSMRPRLLILDEPTSGLDAVMKQNFMQLIMEVAASGDTTIFFSTHNLHDLERMADQVAVMMQGKLLLNSSLDDLKMTTRKIQAVFPNGLPEEIAQSPHVLRVESQGKVYSIIVGSHFEEMMARIQSLQPVYLETVDLSLEEVFIHTVGKEGYLHEPVSFA
ncbi:MAG: ABC transporter ATP-binding protein [Tumebacillaceae bacterium]